MEIKRKEKSYDKRAINSRSNVDQIFLGENSFLTSSSENLPLNWYFYDGSFSRAWINKYMKTVRFRTGGDLSPYSAVIELKYTKTTD